MQEILEKLPVNSLERTLFIQQSYSNGENTSDGVTRVNGSI